jgi:hypothetical protein
MQQWPGNQTFFADGFWVLGSRWPGAVGTAVLVIALEILFITLVALRLPSPVKVVAVVTGCASNGLSDCQSQEGVTHPYRLVNMVSSHDKICMKSHCNTISLLHCRVFFCTLTLVFLLQICLTDPGILPQYEPSEAYLRMQLLRWEHNSLPGFQSTMLAS